MKPFQNTPFLLEALKDENCLKAHNSNACSSFYVKLVVGQTFIKLPEEEPRKYAEDDLELIRKVIEKKGGFAHCLMDGELDHFKHIVTVSSIRIS